MKRGSRHRQVLNFATPETASKTYRDRIIGTFAHTVGKIVDSRVRNVATRGPGGALGLANIAHPNSPESIKRMGYLLHAIEGYFPHKDGLNIFQMSDDFGGMRQRFFSFHMGANIKGGNPKLNEKFFGNPKFRRIFDVTFSIDRAGTAFSRFLERSKSRVASLLLGFPLEVRFHMDLLRHSAYLTKKGGYAFHIVAGDKFPFRIENIEAAGFELAEPPTKIYSQYYKNEKPQKFVSELLVKLVKVRE